MSELEELAAERKRINKAYKEAVAAERELRKPIEAAIERALPEITKHMNAALYRKKCAERLAALHDSGNVTFKELGNA